MFSSHDTTDTVFVVKIFNSVTILSCCICYYFVNDSVIKKFSIKL